MVVYKYELVDSEIALTEQFIPYDESHTGIGLGIERYLLDNGLTVLHYDDLSLTVPGVELELKEQQNVTVYDCLFE